MKSDEFVRAYGESRASAILRTSIADAAAAAMDAAARGGFRIVEFTLTTPGAFDCISRFAGRDDLIVGAGTVLTVEQARQSIEAGAQFLVSPVLDQQVIAEAVRNDVAMMPGCSTPTEMLAAHNWGAKLQKLFPAPGTGPAWVKQTLGPLPFLKIVPTSGVDETNAAAFLAAGAFAVGFTVSLFDPADLAARDFTAVEKRARRLLEAVSRAD